MITITLDPQYEAATPEGVAAIKNLREQILKR
jgi:hypothetical protein